MRCVAVLIVSITLAACNNTVGTSSPRQKAYVVALGDDPAFGVDIEGFSAGSPGANPGTSGGGGNASVNVVQIWERVDPNQSTENAAQWLVEEMVSNGWSVVSVTCDPLLVAMTKDIESEQGEFTASAMVAPEVSRIVLTADDVAPYYETWEVRDCPGS
jgi:hypothetical protein